MAFQSGRSPRAIYNRSAGNGASNGLGASGVRASPRIGSSGLTSALLGYGGSDRESLRGGGLRKVNKAR